MLVLLILLISHQACCSLILRRLTSSLSLSLSLSPYLPLTLSLSFSLSLSLTQNLPCLCLLNRHLSLQSLPFRSSLARSKAHRLAVFGIMPLDVKYRASLPSIRLKNFRALSSHSHPASDSSDTSCTDFCDFSS
jgi:hypothetical protein